MGGGTIWTFENLPISQLVNYLISLLLGMKSPNVSIFDCDLKYNIGMPGFFCMLSRLLFSSDALLCSVLLIDGSCAFIY